MADANKYALAYFGSSKGHIAILKENLGIIPFELLLQVFSEVST